MAKDHKSVDLSPDPIVTASQSYDDDQTVIRLRGYLGKSNASGYVRLYWDLSFHGYYDIKSDDILDRIRLGAMDDNGLFGSLLIVKFSARLRAVEADSVEAEWIEGAVTLAHLRQTGGYSFGGPPPTTHTMGWPPTTHPTRY